MAVTIGIVIETFDRAEDEDLAESIKKVDFGTLLQDAFHRWVREHGITDLTQGHYYLDDDSDYVRAAVQYETEKYPSELVGPNWGRSVRASRVAYHKNRMKTAAALHHIKEVRVVTSAELNEMRAKEDK